MTKRSVSLLLVFTVLFTLFTPFSTTVIAPTDSIAILSEESKDKGIRLKWKTTSQSEEEESFTILKTMKSCLKQQVNSLIQQLIKTES